VYLVKHRPGRPVSLAKNQVGDNIIEFEVRRLSKGDRLDGDTGSRELGLVIFGGRCRISAGSQTFDNLGSRKNVFEGKPAAAYIPKETAYIIETGSWVDLALCFGPATRSGRPARLEAEAMTRYSVGEYHWKRYAYTLIDPMIAGAERLFVGEVVFPAGHSQFPPHKHDQDEELYYYRTPSPWGYGVQLVYNDDKTEDLIYKVQDNDLVLIPKGYHPVSAPAGNILYVLWVMSIPEERVPLVLEPDPTWAWAVGMEWNKEKAW